MLEELMRQYISACAGEHDVWWCFLRNYGVGP